MRAIETQEIRDKRKKRNQLVIGIILIGIMILSSAGYALINSFSGNNQANLGEKYGLVYDGSFWNGEVQGRSISLTLDPDEAKNVPVEIGSKRIDYYYGKAVYVVPNGDVFSFNQISSNFGSFGISVREACYGSCEKNLPEKTCADDLIVLNNSVQENKVYVQENCVFIDGNSDSTEAFIYRLLDIIP